MSVRTFQFDPADLAGLAPDSVAYVNGKPVVRVTVIDGVMTIYDGNDAATKGEKNDIR